MFDWASVIDSVGQCFKISTLDDTFSAKRPRTHVTAAKKDDIANWSSNASGWPIFFITGRSMQLRFQDSQMECGEAIPVGYIKEEP